MNLAILARAADFLLRLAFFAVAPFALVFIAQLFPVTGAVVQIAMALVVFVASEAVRERASKSRLAKTFLSNQLAFDAYYREHPPRPFLYYVFYPILFPYWLWVPSARREFLVYKGYTLISFGLLIVSLAVQYVRAFPPQLSVRDFLPIAGGTLLAETAVVLMFMMPIVTTVVHLHRERAPRRLSVLLIAAFVSIGFAALRLERRRDPVVSYATRTRVRLRTAAAPYHAVEAQTRALSAAWKVLPHERNDVDTDGKVEDELLDTARNALETFYKSDEAYSFDLWYTHQNKHGVIVIYFEARRGHEPIWLAMDHTRHAIHDTAKLPTGAFAAMHRAAN